MPKITKDIKNNTEIEEKNKSTKTSSKSKKSVAKTESKPVSKKSDTSKKSSTTKSAKKTTNKVTAKKTTSKVAAKNTTTAKKKSATKKMKTVFASEYYDLPYRYNETIVKLLAQTPHKLFVYWDISDNDRENYIKQYGPEFFNRTTPVLLVHNETKNYTFRVIINDFANSWYIPVSDDDCKYHIELGRIPKDMEFYIPNNYIFVTASNKIDTPNGHVLLDKLPQKISFKNLKTQEVTYKEVSSFATYNSAKNIYGFYQKLYEDVQFNVTDNPSSGFKGF